MLVVETIARIRRAFFVTGKSIKEIVRDLKVSRNTVRKVLRSGATAFAYEREEPGVSGSILEGLDEILTVIRLCLPRELRRSLACTNIVENALGTVRQVSPTLSAGAMPRWPCVGPPPACWRPRQASAASRPTGCSPSSARPWLTTCERLRPTAPLKPSCGPHSMFNQRCVPHLDFNKEWDNHE